MTRLKITYRDPASLIPYENNPRINENTVPYLANSIDRYGFLVPVLVDKDDTIIAGHTRVLAAKELGLNEVPTICASDLTKEQADEFRLIDNRIQELSYWDHGMLREEMAKLDLDWESYGFEPMALPDDIPIWEGPAEPVEDHEEYEDNGPAEISPSDKRTRLLVTVPSGVDASDIVGMLEDAGCIIKMLD